MKGNEINKHKSVQCSASGVTSLLLLTDTIVMLQPKVADVCREK